jgi:hypothetical protein
MAAPALAAGKPVTGDQLGPWFQEIQSRLSALETPKRPMPLFATVKSALPPPASCFNCAALLTDLGVVATSNGANWLNAATGAVIA